MLGKLAIPGFSTYLQRIDAKHLLSIGFDVVDGDFASFAGLTLQHFDVSDLMAPSPLFKETIGSRGTSSEAATDHLAFLLHEVTTPAP